MKTSIIYIVIISHEETASEGFLSRVVAVATVIGNLTKHNYKLKYQAYELACYSRIPE
jgi:hypothetical protein